MKYQSEALEAVHETAADLYDIGLLSKEKMDDFNKVCLIPGEALNGGLLSKENDEKPISCNTKTH